jgi:hypothetical protein
MNADENQNNSNLPICLICRDVPDQPVNLCVDNHEHCCTRCWEQYVNSLVRQSFLGTCPCIVCPNELHFKLKRKRILPFETWSSIVPLETSKKFSLLASSLLAFLCGGCHILKSLDVGFDSTGTTNEKLKNIFEINSTIAEAILKFDELDSLLFAYCTGEQDVDDVYQTIVVNIFPQMIGLTDSDAWEVFVLILKKLPDPERRANLHLRYLRDRPRIRMLCCNREHCFHCKTKDFHEGKSCVEHLSTLDHSIVTCPSCGIALAKGDGCNTITCVCGKQFSWTAEKESTEGCRTFLLEYPNDTNNACAHILCENSDIGQLQRAKAWQARNRIEVSGQLLRWFHHRYPQCTSQCSIVLSSDTMTDGVREAKELWIQLHPKEVEHCRQQNDYALRSIFLSLAPSEPELPLFAHRIICSNRGQSAVDSKLLQSAIKWIESNKETYQQGIEAMEERSANQFLFKFGSRPVFSIRSAKSTFPCATEWSRSLSNHDLTINQRNSTVERAGSISCYPAAFATLVAERCAIRVVVDNAPRTSNWLTFGVASRAMAPSSSDGVGRTSNTWGISDDRSSSATKAIVASSGSEVGTFRKLCAGDVLSAVIDVVEGWVEITINDTEFHHRFIIPTGSVDDYLFAMTFANDHRASILSEPIERSSIVSHNDDSNNKSTLLLHSLSACTNAMREVVLNNEQTKAFNQLRKRIKAMIDPVDETTTIHAQNSAPRKQFASSNNSIFADTTSWLNKWEGSLTLARAEFEKLRSSIEELVGSQPVVNQALASQHELTWKLIVQAVSWYDQHRERIRQDIRTEMALMFQMTHGPDAPFLAAMTLQEYHNRRMNRSDIDAPLAYMQCFQADMNDWYEQDSCAREPMIEGVARGCQCLPRHLRVCPVIKNKTL